MLINSNNIFAKIWNFLWNIYYKNSEVWNYLIVGFLTTIVNIVTKMILLSTMFDAKDAFELQIAVIIAWIVAVIFAYITNRIIVFKSKSKRILKEFITFIGGRIATLLLEMALMWFFITFLKLNSSTWILIWNVTIQFIVIVANYFISKLFVFKK